MSFWVFSVRFEIEYFLPSKSRTGDFFGSAESVIKNDLIKERIIVINT